MTSGDGPAAASTAERNRTIFDRYRDGVPQTVLAEEHGLSTERVRQIVRREEELLGIRPPRARSRSRRKGESSGERVRLRIGNLAKAVLVTGQAYQDPKDALNEFVSNAADEYAEAGMRGERIRIVLRRKGRHPVIAVDDTGRGMSPDRLRAVASSLFESTKAGDDRTLGEKAIGLLAFQQLGGRCEIVSRAAGSEETWTLRLDRGSANASLGRERRRARQVAGTTMYLSELDPDVLRVLTQRKVVEYLRRRRGAAIARGDYVLEVVEGRTPELVTAEEPEGVRLAIAAHNTLWGKIEFSLYVAADADRHRRVAVVGRAGTTIIDDLSELDEFDREPWTSGQVSGQIIFEALQQTAGRRAVLRDRDAFPVFRDAVESIEPFVIRSAERLRAEIDAQTTDRLSDTLRRIFGRVLKELADLENPMRTPVGGAGEGDGHGLEPDGADDDTLFSQRDQPPDRGRSDAEDTEPAADDDVPDLDELARPPAPVPPPGGVGRGSDAATNRFRELPSVEPDPDPGYARSRFESERRVVLFNDRHADYLMVKDDELSLLDYLATLVAKEYVVFNNPRASTEDLAEEMVRMLVRVRRHLPKRRS